MIEQLNVQKNINLIIFSEFVGIDLFFSHSYIQSLILKMNQKKNIYYELISNNNKNKLVDQGLTVRDFYLPNFLKNLTLKKDLMIIN